MDLEDMQTFLAVVRNGGITQAAVNLHISQSTISYRVKSLETELGLTLFERGPGQRSTMLTASGEKLVQYADRWTELARDIKTIRQKVPSFELEIGCIDSLNQFILPPLYRQLIQQYPQSRVRIRTQQSLEAYRSIENREIDVAFTAWKLHREGILTEPVFHEKMYLICNKNSRLQGEKIHPRDLDKRYELYLEWSDIFTLWHNTWFDPDIPPYLWIDNNALVLNFLQEPQFWTICSESVATVLLQRSDLKKLNLAVQPPDRITYLLSHKTPSNNVLVNVTRFKTALRTFCNQISYGCYK